MYSHLFDWLSRFQTSLELFMVTMTETNEDAWELSLEQAESFLGDTPEECFAKADKWCAEDLTGVFGEEKEELEDIDFGGI